MTSLSKPLFTGHETSRPDLVRTKTGKIELGGPSHNRNILTGHETSRLNWNVLAGHDVSSRFASLFSLVRTQTEKKIELGGRSKGDGSVPSPELVGRGTFSRSRSHEASHPDLRPCSWSEQRKKKLSWVS